MLDKSSEQMLDAAVQLTEEDLDSLRGAARPSREVAEPEPPEAEAGPSEPDDVDNTQPDSAGAAEPTTATSAGERERRRTRESKIATACVGNQRPQHEWWPVGTELVGRLGHETFTAEVVLNPGVKSGRSLMLTSGPQTGKVYKTPTRAALEATEHHRQANQLGRGGGVTNGWTFWKVKS